MGLLDQMRLLNALVQRKPGRNALAIEEHISIVDAIAAGHGNEAAEYARRHVEFSHQALGESLGV